MNAVPRKDAAAVLERREREKALATLVRKRLSAGFSDPDDDLAVDRLAEAVKGMSSPLRRALIGEYGDWSGPRKLASLLDGDLDDASLEQVWRVLADARLKPLAERTVDYHDLVGKATRTLLANPMSVDSVTNDRYFFPNLVADILRHEADGGKPVDDMAPPVRRHENRRRSRARSAGACTA